MIEPFDHSRTGFWSGIESGESTDLYSIEEIEEIRFALKSDQIKIEIEI